MKLLFSTLLIFSLAAGLSAACIDTGGDSDEDNGGSDGDGGGSFQVETEAGGAVSFHEGEPVPEGDEGSDVFIGEVAGNTSFIPGGTNKFSGAVTSGARAVVGSLAVGFLELDGWFEVELGDASFEFLVTVAQDVELDNLTLVIVPVLEGGGYGQPYTMECTVTSVGTGDLQVSLSWDTPTDVDLHLVEPTGEEIYYGWTSSYAGGVLDLDSNASCALDNINNENITYEGVEPPAGTYVVRVDYWSACDVQEETSYVVTVTVRGEATVYEGTFTPEEADSGGAGSGVEVTAFEF